MTHYAESIKRNPDDPRGFTNRAAAYTKLMALPEALKDAEKAIEMDPTFGASASLRSGSVSQGRRADSSPSLHLPSRPPPLPHSRLAVKGYIRKSHVLFAMKEFDKALAAVELVRPSPLSAPPPP